MEEQAQTLAKSGKTASAGGMFRYLGSMVYNGEAMLRAREIERETKEEKERQKKTDEDEVMEDLFEKADQVYLVYVDRGESLGRLNNDELKILIKFIIKLEAKPKDTLSKHKNATMMKARLNQCHPSWTKYFEGSVEAEGGSDDSDTNDDAPTHE